MCGIVGWVNFDLNLSDKHFIISKMADKLINRGPDSYGVWTSEHVAFAQRRLIVIDPDGGMQPMIKEYGSKKYIIIYNGEVYNTSELRKELESYGHKFKTYSDTEVLLTSYIQWGYECLEKLNGIFAFAIWDEDSNNLFIARDRLGVKPLFYTVANKSFIFASEIKAILAHPDIKAEVDADGLAEIFIMGPARTPGSGVFRGIKELKGGFYLVFDRKGTHIKQYWSLKSHPHTDNLEVTKEKIKSLLKDAVERQLVSDVPICSLLSGGLDSTAVSAFANNAIKSASDGKLITYSVDYVDNDKYFKPSYFQPNSDFEWVQKVSKDLDTEHRYVIIKNQDLADALKPALYARDLPGMADIDASLYLFLKEVKKGATVALSGEGADEVFGGYPWFRDKRAIDGSTFPWVRKLEERVRLLSQEVVQYIRPFEYIRNRYNEALDEVPKLYGEDLYHSRIREIFYLNITRFLPMLLDRMDRMSMASGLEVRVPFLDHRLVEYVWNIPWEMKNYNDKEKGILRYSLKGVVPDYVIERKKSPYPKTHNPLYKQIVKQWLQDILEDISSPILSIVNKKEIMKLIKTDAEEFDPAWFSQLMGSAQLFAYLVQINLWFREYKVSVV